MQTPPIIIIINKSVSTNKTTALNNNSQRLFLSFIDNGGSNGAFVWCFIEMELKQNNEIKRYYWKAALL